MKTMPVVFAGHGSPMNAIEDNRFAAGWRELGRRLPRPKAVLCVSAHWETWGCSVTAMAAPRTIHDFGGFPRALYQVNYPAPGSPWLAEEVMKIAGGGRIAADADWGLDHGCWSVLSRMYPAADIPVVQLSLDATLSPGAHLELGRELAPLRDEGVLIMGSGNIVHNLRLVSLPEGGDFNTPFGFPWAQEANAILKELIEKDDAAALADYPSLGDAVRLAVPTPEHYLPMLYVTGVRRGGEHPAWFNDEAVGGSLTMTSFVLG